MSEIIELMWLLEPNPREQTWPNNEYNAAIPYNYNVPEPDQNRPDAASIPVRLWDLNKIRRLQV